MASAAAASGAARYGGAQGDRGSAAARLEDERGAWGGRLAAQDAVVNDDQAAIEQFAHVDGEAGVGAAAAPQLHRADAEVHGVIARDHAAVATAEQEGQIARRAAPHALRVRRGFAKAPIEVRDELGQVGLGRLDGTNGAQAQLTDEPILQRGPQPLHAALGLGRVGGDVAHGEGLQHAPQMRRGLRTGELFGHGPVRVVTDQEIEPIAIHGQRQPVRGEDLAKEGGVAVDILGRPELQGEDLGGGIVDGAQQHQLGAPRLEPGERTAVDLNQGAAGRGGHPAATPPGRSPGALRSEP